MSERPTDDELDGLVRHAEYGHLEGQDYDAVVALVAEVRRLRADRDRPCEHETLPNEWEVRHGELLHAYRDKRAEVRQLRAERDRHVGALAECYRLSGADPDGNEDRRLAPYAVMEVARMRDECDEADVENVRLRGGIAEHRECRLLEPNDDDRRLWSLLDPEVQPNPDDALALRHQKHYRQCECLGDASECCEADCPCHDPEVQP